MAEISFTIQLTSDAEPGTGLGGEVVNDLAPRDHRQRLTIPASHVKGLMRAAWQTLSSLRGWRDGQEIETRVFGVPHATDPSDPVIRLTGAVPNATRTLTTKFVTRTALEASGVAQDQSLRTTESIPVGTEFVGSLHAACDNDSAEDLAWRLALLSIPAIGGSRNRGCGECLVSIQDETRGPGKLLGLLDEKLRRGLPALRVANNAAATSLKQSSVVMRLVFRAHSPICCPEFPDKTNVITTGFSIPASAVQGVILNRLNATNPSLADALFASDQFRCWPLQPCAEPSDQSIATDQLPTAIRVSLTHRAAKYSFAEDWNERDFFDEAIDGDAWPDRPDGAPLKASDGVLLRHPDGTRKLWKAGAMPHVVTAHGVHSDQELAGRRNLFTVDAMAPLTWSGLVAMPEEAAVELQKGLQKDATVAIGKSRSVRGLGTLEAAVVRDVPDEWQTQTVATILIVQSPILLEPIMVAPSADEDLLDLACNWAKAHGLPKPTQAWANVGIRFGWSRHGQGFQKAQRVALPGSVIQLSGKVHAQRLKEVFTSCGLGVGPDAGRHLGLGALAVHPGKAQSLFQRQPKIREVGGSDRFAAALQVVLKLHRESKRLPSPSQIRAVQQRLSKVGTQDALQFLTKQMEDRTNRVWATWQGNIERFKELLAFDSKIAARALEVLADLSIANEKASSR